MSPEDWRTFAGSSEARTAFFFSPVDLKICFLPYLYQKSQQTVNSCACFGEGLADAPRSRPHLQVTLLRDDETLNGFDLQLWERELPQLLHHARRNLCLCLSTPAYKARVCRQRAQTCAWCVDERRDTWWVRAAAGCRDRSKRVITGLWI